MSDQWSEGQLQVPNFDFIDWDDESEERGNTRHIAHNGLTTDEVEEVLHDPASRDTVSKSTGRPATIGTTSAGKTIFVTYELEAAEGYVILRPVTAYEID